MYTLLILQPNHVAYTRIVCIGSGRNAVRSSRIIISMCVCLFASFFCFSDDFYFHLALIERKIMHTFISFWFQSHTFREDERKTDYCAFFIGCFMLWKTHFMYTCVCARVKFSSITAAAADVAVYISLPHSFCVE